MTAFLNEKDGSLTCPPFCWPFRTIRTVWHSLGSLGRTVVSLDFCQTHEMFPLELMFPCLSRAIEISGVTCRTAASSAAVALSRSWFSSDMMTG